MAKQSPAERLFTLTCALLAAPRLGVSKRQLLLSVPGYQESKSPEALDRMFERDKVSLKEAGIALQVLDGDGSENPDDTRYRISPESFRWPKDLVMTTERIQLLELAARAWNQQSMRQSAVSAVTRLKSLGLVQSGHEFEIFSPRILARHAAFTPLADAIAQGVQVRFEYQKPGATPSSREVSPIKLRLIEGQWVLLASESEEIKNFLLRRIASGVLVLEQPQPNLSKAAIDKAEQDLVEFVASQSVDLELEPESEAWVRFGSPESHRITLNFMDSELLVEDLLELAHEITVISPQGIRDLLAKKLAQVVSAHA